MTPEPPRRLGRGLDALLARKEPAKPAAAGAAAGSAGVAAQAAINTPQSAAVAVRARRCGSGVRNDVGNMLIGCGSDRARGGGGSAGSAGFCTICL